MFKKMISILKPVKKEDCCNVKIVEIKEEKCC